ncbi:NUDIX domain-containing protein [Paramicrobacterium agarici]|uniref:ADP-ribose pyrophosphatase YjhB (NUDIX family) n=1 Tax=Paramicrobacterium agarici TaxID=630514 RepID=A0A2A9DY87_9MICO|nr:NUDIX domain-containing protein [Microbacterium agarici]PFG31095.1 ADP-ribose pyrophosphatase YjhB (NUDIX family) [Microbacterium agarici]
MADIIAPEPGEPRRPFGPRDSGDAWVEGERGRFWGRYGAAGLLAWDPARGVLLQHRAEWSDQGGTWGLPGGALHAGERAIDGALREAHEEAAVPAGQLIPRATSTFSVGYWSYTTVIADVHTSFEPLMNDHESIALEWVPVDSVASAPLHPGLEASWPRLRSLLGRAPQLVVDAANVVGSRPNGWWRDRFAAAERLRDRLESLSGVGIADDDDPSLRWSPEITMVVEGKARGVENSAHVRVVDAPAEGDDEIVEQVAALIAGQTENDVTVITSDRELAARVDERGGRVHGAAWLLERMDAVTDQ